LTPLFAYEISAHSACWGFTSPENVITPQGPTGFGIGDTALKKVALAFCSSQHERMGAESCIPSLHDEVLHNPYSFRSQILFPYFVETN